MDTRTSKRVEVEVDQAKGTYAQTIDRNGFTVVGMGKPLFDVSYDSRYRSSGFMSEESIFKNDQTVFKNCMTVKQCFVDTFTYNGKEVKRQVLDPETKRLRDWRGVDGQNCGVFGIWIEKEARQTFCPGATEARHCCMLDPAVTPIFYMFRYHAREMHETLSKACNADPLFTIYDAGTINTHLKNVGAYYTTSTDTVKRNVELAAIKYSMNEIMDEFTPGFGRNTMAPSVSSEYVQLMDCSVALYEALQTYTACAPGSALGSSPFCTEYSRKSPNRIGIHYFLDYTMVEVPFAWWHKCMLLQGRTFKQVW